MPHLHKTTQKFNISFKDIELHLSLLSYLKKVLILAKDTPMNGEIMSRTFQHLRPLGNSSDMRNVQLIGNRFFIGSCTIGHRKRFTPPLSVSLSRRFKRVRRSARHPRHANDSFPTLKMAFSRVEVDLEFVAVSNFANDEFRQKVNLKGKRFLRRMNPNTWFKIAKSRRNSLEFFYF